MASAVNNARQRLATETPMSVARLVSMTTLALIAFAANSLLCRAALADGSIDAASRRASPCKNVCNIKIARSER